MANYTTCVVPSAGQAISTTDGVLSVPDRPIIPFIEGDGVGPDIWAASVRVLDAAVAKAYGCKRQIQWMEVLAGQKSFDKLNTWLPDETIEAFQQFLVGIKGPLTTPIGGGIRSLNVAMRQRLDLYVCLRPVRYFTGVPSPVKRPEAVDMVIFRENTEDIYAGIEWAAGSDETKKILQYLKQEFPKSFAKVRFPETSAIGIKAVSQEGSQRLIGAAIDYAVKFAKSSVTLVHKGNIMKFTEGGFRDWGYALAQQKYAAEVIGQGPWCLIKAGTKIQHLGLTVKNDITIKDSIADIALQQVLTRPEEFSVIATLNLNGDYLSDALAAQVGGIGIAPGGNINYHTGHAVFEATHGTAPKYTNQDKVNPGSLILSGVMMLEYMGWQEAADLIVKSLESTIAAKTVTYDFARLMEGAKEVKCSGFADEMIKKM